MTDTPTWLTWRSMLGRCYNPNHTSFKYYGGRGISVYPPWKDFSAFVRDMGIRPAGRTLGRIDNAIGYCPNNCEWQTWMEQGRNRSNVVFLELHGHRLCLAEWARLAGIGTTTLHWRLNHGWNLERALDPDTSFGKSERRKTHCPHGHEYSAQNTFRESDGSRKCLICRRKRDRNRIRK